MSLSPEGSVMTGLALGAVSNAIFSQHLPSVVDLRTVEAGNQDVNAATKSATWQSAGVVAGISLITKDPTIFIIGGVITVALAWAHMHANAVSPITHRASGSFSVSDVVRSQIGENAAPQTGGGAHGTVGVMFDTVI